MTSNKSKKKKKKKNSYTHVIYRNQIRGKHKQGCKKEVLIVATIIPTQILLL